MYDWSRRRVLITGASSGIGEELAVAISQRGGAVLLAARRQEELERVKERCFQPLRHRVVLLDLSSAESVYAVGGELEKQHGPIDIVIHNAGISQRARAVDTTLAVERQVLEVNYFGPIALTKALLPSMIARKAGHIVVVSSVTGHVGTPFRSAYAASKHALHGYFDALRAEVYASNIQVTIACPGFVRTNISMNAVRGDGSTHARRDPGQKRGISPEHCARSIVRAIERGAHEMLVGGPEIAAVYAKRLVPGLVDRMIRRVRVT